MPRTFSLARLMLGVTLFCGVCAFAVKFPDIAFFVAILSVMLASTYWAWLTVAKFSRHRRVLVFVCLLGAFFGYAFACVPAAGLLLDVTRDHDRWWIVQVAPLIPIPGPAVGVLLSGGAFVLCETYLRWYESKESS